LARNPVRLTIAIADTPQTAALRDGRCPIEGVAADFINVVPQIAAYRRMVREVAFDVCELAPTTYAIARAHGAPFVALPIFVARRFHHAGLLVRPDAGIQGPRDLAGKRVGVRAWSVTTGAWTRGILAAEFGLDLARVTWVVDDEEHVAALRLPPNVEPAPAGRSLADLMAAGELHAGFAGNAGVGRAGPPVAGWDSRKLPPADYPELFADAAARETEWFGRTGIYPMHGTIVVRDAVLAEHPFVAHALFDAFERAKRDWLERLDAGIADAPTDRAYRGLQQVVGPDPLPYGIAANLPTITALADYAFRQGLIPQQMPIEQLFVDPQVT
jgi:4,5-dihydroxyphthalate decarboxylase